MGRIGESRHCGLYPTAENTTQEFLFFGVIGQKITVRPVKCYDAGSLYSSRRRQPLATKKDG